MTDDPGLELDPDLDLVLVRELAAPRAVIWRCWTEPEHLMQWFVPKPHKVTACHLDVRVGGACNTTFDVDGAVMENKGVYLEVVPGEKLVFTDTYTEGWKPAAEPFMTAIVTFEDLGGGGRAIPPWPGIATPRARGSIATWGSMTGGGRWPRSWRPMRGGWRNERCALHDADIRAAGGGPGCNAVAGLDGPCSAGDLGRACAAGGGRVCRSG